jgi:lambda family phage minor tail protein L
MAGEGKNKVAKSLLDLQPTAVLELFRVFPDRINKPTLFLGFHGGTLYDKSLVWQGVQYLPLAIETDGFDILADGQLARPKVKVTNKNNIITNFLQNYKDFVNAKLVRKRVSVKFLDDENFDGGNPFGVADPKAELTNQEWIVGRKISESKLFVEFELNSPLDLESFSINSRGVVSKFCYWQYRGEGCRYEGQPIEQEDGNQFRDIDGNSITPKYRRSLNPNASGPESRLDFFFDPAAEWSASNLYEAGDTVYVKSPTISIAGTPLKTVYVCVSGNSAQIPEGNPSFWQKDGCTKKFSACQKRFNDNPNLSFIQGQNIQTGFSGVKLEGAKSNTSYIGPINSGRFFSTQSELTGIMTGEFCVVGWANVNVNSPIDAGIFSTTTRDDGNFPTARFINIGGSNKVALNNRNIDSFHLSQIENPTAEGTPVNAEINMLNSVQKGARWWRAGREWQQYSITHETGVQGVLDGLANPTPIPPESSVRNLDTSLTIKVNNLPIPPSNQQTAVEGDLINGNFASLNSRSNLVTTAGDSAPCFPQTFTLGAVEKRFANDGFETNAESFISTINGAIGPWAIWSRKLTSDELDFLYKIIRTPNETQTANQFDVAPRDYYECTGTFSSITGNGLVAWWDGTTGHTSIGNGLRDIHGIATGTHSDATQPYGLHLTGSGVFSAIEESYQEAPQILLSNETSPFPRFGGYPGTDGFSYERNSSIY